MANIFNLTNSWKEIIDMADQLDDQTLEDTLEAIEEEAGDKVANTIAVIKSIKSELELAKEFKKSIEEKIRTMDNTISRLNEYVLLGVDTIGKPKKDAPEFKKLEIKGAPWVKSAWTQYNPPKVNVIDERLLDPEYLIPQDPKVDTKLIAKHWKQNAEEFEAMRSAFLLELQTLIDENKIHEEEADARLVEFDENNNPGIKGVEVIQTVGVRYR